jgi:hypothetical protein
VFQAPLLSKNLALAIFVTQVSTVLHLALKAAFHASQIRFLHSLAQFRKRSVKAALQGPCPRLERESALIASLELSDHTNQLLDAWAAPRICFQVSKPLNVQFVNEICSESPRTAKGYYVHPNCSSAILSQNQRTSLLPSLSLL